jgi:hypothetical protein
LRATEEDALGTSDYAADTDGDGVADGLEARLYRTSPTSAADTPTPLESAQVPRLTPDLTHVLRHDPSAGTWVRRNLATGVEQTSSALPAAPVRDLLPLSNEVVLVTEGNPVSGYAEKLFRYGGGNRFAVVNVNRTACPIVGNVDGLARCGTPEARLPGILNVWLVGWDAALKLALVKVASQHGRLLLGVSETDAVLLANLVVPGEKLNVGTAFTLPTGGYVLRRRLRTAVRVRDGDGAVAHLRLRGAAGPGAPAPAAVRGGAGPRFRRAARPGGAPQCTCVLSASCGTSPWRSTFATSRRTVVRASSSLRLTCLVMRTSS